MLFQRLKTSASKSPKKLPRRKLFTKPPIGCTIMVMKFTKKKAYKERIGPSRKAMRERIGSMKKQKGHITGGMGKIRTKMMIRKKQISEKQYSN